MIYKLNNKQLRKKMKEFGKTNYGKSIFLICYLPFMISFIITLILFLNLNNYSCTKYFIITMIFTVISFSLGNYGYYRELRKFVNK
jgi:amino acid permease